MANDNKSTEKLYLVSFGNSKKYLLRDNSVGKESELTKVEAELNEFLRAKFPDEAFAYYTTPRVDEISQENLKNYLSFPKLDSSAMESIKKVLAKEVEDMESVKRLDSDAPFANVNPGAADIPNILG